MSEPEAPTRDVFTPARLVAVARGLLEDAFPMVWVEGELSNCSRPGSGHLYFTLKDAAAQVRCAMFRMRASLLRFKPADGLRVLLRARVSLYEARGEFQLIVEHMEEAGEGALRREFERLKARLAAEGLFATERKRALPRFVRRLGVLTSPTGAAIRDVLSVVRRRFPMLPVDVIAVPVQGTSAGAEIARALATAAKSGRYDVLLLTRGGGSLEDLWCFNDEALARAIFAAPVPVVSAVGHEVDFTIADFVADLRAPTPSAAAELLVPHVDELCREMARGAQRLEAALRRKLRDAAQRSDAAALKLQALSPARRLALLRTRFAGAHRSLVQCMRAGLRHRAQRLALAAARLAARHPRTTLTRRREALARMRQQLEACTRARLVHDRKAVLALRRALSAVSPLATVERGYAILRAKDGSVVRSIDRVLPGERLRAQVVDGEVDLHVLGTRRGPS